ncbi:hypothetical protein QG37_06829 [Candidozyma auris]|uniref:Uncharacterized protein n=1 Tax=Candidozyma auris TaxID=498019 RepID=A0A0L0NRB8_CANAR|nr:hypothetical protein QG37_06829 [[Candida] auris]
MIYSEKIPWVRFGTVLGFVGESFSCTSKAKQLMITRFQKWIFGMFYRCLVLMAEMMSFNGLRFAWINDQRCAIKR